MGGGLEIALACHYRVASPRNALRMPGSHARHHSRRRRDAAHAAPDRRREDARARARRQARSTRRRRSRSASSMRSSRAICATPRSTMRRTLGRRRRARGARAIASVDPATRRRRSSSGSGRDAARQYPNRQAPLTAIEAVSASARLRCRRDSNTRRAGQRGQGDRRVAGALVHCSSPSERRAGCPDLPRGHRAAADAHAGAVVGAGTMGGGIAICFANAGSAGHVLDVSREALERGLADVDSDVRIDGQARPAVRRRTRRSAWR